jgi:outer membrane protein assembly factor BamB/tetratricopeptide (TPR) repeat protein
MGLGYLEQWRLFMARGYVTTVWLVLWFCTAKGPASLLRAAEPDSPVLLTGESPSTARRLAAADALVQQGQWAEAVDEYLRILDEAGHDLAPVGKEESDGRLVPLERKGTWCVQARQLCHQRLAALPPEALRLYRTRVDGLARKWFDHGAKARDVRLLRRVVDEAFCSQVTDQALDLLGDLAFERGEFREAERWWRMLALPLLDVEGQGTEPGPQPDVRLRFPDPKVDPAQVRAKQMLARLFRGERDGWEEGLRAFRKEHGQAKGHLAGRPGNYADTLQALADLAPVLPAASAKEGWTTFGGNAARAHVLPTALTRTSPQELLRDPQWRLSLDNRIDFGPVLPGPITPVVPASVAARSLAFFPVLVDNQVLVADARFVTAYDLDTGTPAILYDLKRTSEGAPPVLDGPVKPGTAHTLTVAAGRIYARLGAQGLDASARQAESFLVCLNVRPDDTGQHLRWQVRPQVEDPAAPVYFESAPVVRDGRVYIAQTRCRGARTQTAIACYDADSGGGDTGGPLWLQEVCETPAPSRDGPRYRHHLLTLAGPYVVYCSHSGAIVALDALTGQRVWAVRYASRGARTASEDLSPRDLAPCVYAADRLFVAPEDRDRILCLDPASGQVLWQRGPVEVIHLLGVAGGRLVFTTTTPRRGIRALDAATGLDTNGWVQPEVDELSSFGRGLLAGELIYWPTHSGLRILRVEDGRPTESSYPLFLNEAVRGNLAVGCGCLAVAGAEELAVYFLHDRLLERRKQEARLHPHAPLPQYHLALAAYHAGHDDQALELLGRVEQLAGPEDSLQGIPLQSLARMRRHEVLLGLAAQAQAERRWQDAVHCLDRAAGAEFPAPSRLRALQYLATLWHQAGQPDREVAVWQGILRDELLRRVPITPSVSGAEPGAPHQRNLGTGRPAAALPPPGPASQLAAARIQELIRRHGTGVYETFEGQARDRAGSAPGDKQAAELERLTREYPNASGTGPALLQLAVLHDQAGRRGAAAYTYRTYLLRPARGEDRAPALIGLARAYEGQGCWAAARTTWQRLAREQGESVLPSLDSSRSVAEFVSRHLQGPEFRACESSPRPRATLPLSRTWQVAPEANAERLLVPEKGACPSSGSELLFFSTAGCLTCREASSGRTCWVSPLSYTPHWIGRHADTVLVGGTDGVACLSASEGRLLWAYSVADLLGYPLSALGLVPPEARLSGYRLTDTGLFFLQGEYRLYACDLDSGHLLWKERSPGSQAWPWSPGGRFLPRYHAGEKCVVIQTTEGKLWVLDSSTGRKVHEVETGRDRHGKHWPGALHALDERRVCLATDLTQIVLLDLATGKEVWAHTTRSPSACEPQLFGDRTNLFLLLDGYELVRLDPSSGKALWNRAVGSEPIAAETVAFDEAAVYLVSRNVLSAYSLATGQPLWSLRLTGPTGRWQTVATQDHVLAFPAQAQVERWRWYWVPLERHLFYLPAEVVAWHDFPVVFCDRKDGRLVQRLNFTPRGADMAVQVGRRGVVVSGEGVTWGLTARVGPGE